MINSSTGYISIHVISRFFTPRPPNELARSSPERVHSDELNGWMLLAHSEDPDQTSANATSQGNPKQLDVPVVKTLEDAHRHLAY